MTPSCLSRRSFMKTTGLAAGALCASPAGASDAPNVLLLVADRLPGDLFHPRGLAGADLPTAAQIGREWVRFDAACAAMVGDSPGSDAVWLGRPGSETGAMCEGQRASRGLPDLLGWVTEQGQLDLFVAGRVGVSGRSSADLSVICDDVGNLGVLRSMQGFFRNRPPGRPWMAAVGLRGLRDLEAWGLAQSPQVPPVDLGLPRGDLPVLPVTVALDSPTPGRVREHSPRPVGWSESRWHAALWRSMRSLEALDGVLRRLLSSLDGSMHGQNTVVMITSAQGSPLASHGRLNPGGLLEGSVRVPWAVRWPWGRASKAVVVPVSTLDLVPTVCATLGLPLLPDARGTSLRPVLDGYPASPRTEVVTEALIEGRAVRSGEFRYIQWRNDPLKQLYHLASAPAEDRNLAENAGYSSVVLAHRAALERWEAGLRPTESSQLGWVNDAR